MTFTWTFSIVTMLKNKLGVLESSETFFSFLLNNQQMQLFTVNFIPLPPEAVDTVKIVLLMMGV